MTMVMDEQVDGLERPHGHVFTVAEAAIATRLSVSTLRRKIRNGQIANAYKSSRYGTETWMVPLAGLLAAGIRVNTPDRGQPLVMDDQVDDHGRAPEHSSRTRLAELEQQVAVLRAELVGARAVADERAKRAETAERALLMLEARNPRPVSLDSVSAPVPTPAAPLPPTPALAPVKPSPRPRHWWSRRTL